MTSCGFTEGYVPDYFLASSRGSIIISVIISRAYVRNTDNINWDGPFTIYYSYYKNDEHYNINNVKYWQTPSFWHCDFDQFIFDKGFLILHLVSDPCFLRNKGGSSSVKTVHKYLCENY